MKWSFFCFGVVFLFFSFLPLFLSIFFLPFILSFVSFFVPIFHLFVYSFLFSFCFFLFSSSFDFSILLTFILDLCLALKLVELLIQFLTLSYSTLCLPHALWLSFTSPSSGCAYAVLPIPLSFQITSLPFICNWIVCLTVTRTRWKNCQHL